MAAILAFAFEALMCEFAGVVCTAFHVYLQVLLRCASTSAPLHTAWCNILHCQDFGCLLMWLALYNVLSERKPFYNCVSSWLNSCFAHWGFWTWLLVNASRILFMLR